MRFEPDWRNIQDAAYNRVSRRLPLYEHLIGNEIIEDVSGKKLTPLLAGNDRDLDEFFRGYCGFFRDMGYDTVSYECCIGPVMPGSGALGKHIEGVIGSMADFRAYPWDEIPELYFGMYGRLFDAMARNLPEGMRAVGGVGNGIFECVQELTGYMSLCYIREDDPELYAMLFAKVGEVSLKIWQTFLERHASEYCCLRFGDDLGYKSNTMISAGDIRSHIIPQYAAIIREAHANGKPFIYHSCGAIWNVMDDLIDVAKIDVKHSNEDVIGGFEVWVERYGHRIGNFGGVDMTILCDRSSEAIAEYVRALLNKVAGRGGIAVGSGNSIPYYVPKEGYFAMIEAVRSFRGE